MKTITEKLGLKGKITQKHAEDIEEIIQEEIKQARQQERERIIEIIEEDRENIYNFDNIIEEINITN